MLIKSALLIFILYLAVPSEAAISVGDVALSVTESDEVADAAISAGLSSSDPSMRVIACRVALVKKRSAFVSQIRKLLETEDNVEAAREEIRALILMEGAAAASAAMSANARFEERLDATILVAVARLGTDVATGLYFEQLNKLRTKPQQNFFLLSLWGKPERITPLASRLLSKREPEPWSQLLSALRTSKITLQSGITQVALTHPLESVRRDTLRFLLQSLLDRDARVSDASRQAIKDTVWTGEPEEDVTAFSRELLKRMLGQPPMQKPEWVAWIATPAGSDFIRSYSKPEFLTSDEKTAAQPGPKQKELKPRGRSIEGQALAPPPFFFGALPSGISSAVLNTTQCKAEWVGLGTTLVDSQGRIEQLDVTKVETSGGCRKALEAITRLALVHNSSILSPFRSESSVFIRPARSGLCNDEGQVPPRSETDFQSCAPSMAFEDPASGCRVPVTKKRVQPKFPEASRRSMGKNTSSLVIVEALITKEGCIRDARLVLQSLIPGINREALLALLQWRFEPATLGGVPVDVLFNLTVNFNVSP